MIQELIAYTILACGGGIFLLLLWANVCKDHEACKPATPAEPPSKCEACGVPTDRSLFYGARLCPTCCAYVDVITAREDQ